MLKVILYSFCVCALVNTGHGILYFAGVSLLSKVIYSCCIFVMTVAELLYVCRFYLVDLMYLAGGRS